MEPALRVICLECWQHISDFHSFQQWIVNAQAQQEDLKFFIHEETSEKQITDPYVTDLNIHTTNAIVSNESNTSSSSSEIAPKYEYEKCSDKKGSINVDIVDHENDTQTSTECHNENSFKCESCGASFSHYGNLRRHVRKKHTVQPLLKWICKNCNKFFKNRTHLERHKNKLHNCELRDNSESVAKQKDNDENCMTDSDPEDLNIYKVSKIFGDGNNASNLQSSKVNRQQQRQKETSDNTLLLMKQMSDNINSDLDFAVESSSTKIDHTVQIQMPVLDIVDIKDEISTDAESNEDTSKLTNNNEVISDVEEEYDDFLARWKGDLKCPRCNQQVRNYSHLSEHFNLKHPEERCYVNCCHITLYDRQSIAEHLRFHENPNVFECTHCGKCFKNKKGLRSHKLQVHSDNRSTYHLHLCHCKRAQEIRAKKLNTETHMEYDTVVCCPRKKKILEDDSLIAKWKKQLICEICKASFSYFSLMRTHFYHEHPGEKCNISCCNRKMSRISDALEHIRFHLDPHAYRCKICNVDFSAKNTLAKHMRNAHVDALPKHKWACDECDKTFEIRQILTRHKNVCHSKKT